MWGRSESDRRKAFVERVEDLEFLAKHAESPIWRYMDLTKFVWLLQQHRLYFCRSDLLGGPFEGSIPLPTLRKFAEQLEELKAQHRDIPADFFDRGGANLAELRGQTRKRIVCNCWHLNEVESTAMWRLYSHTGDAIAIRSTVKRLGDQMPAWAALTRVRYIDYSKYDMSLGDFFGPFSSKRKSFERENEVRAIVHLDGIFPGAVADGGYFEESEGIAIPVKLASLIEAIYVSPTATPLFARVVARLIEEAEIRVPVRQSDLDSTPLF